jgi:hypothetical protein
MSFNLYRMECRERCHDRFVGLLLAGHTLSIGAARSNARGAVVQAPHLSQGFGDSGEISRKIYG